MTVPVSADPSIREAIDALGMSDEVKAILVRIHDEVKAAHASDLAELQPLLQLETARIWGVMRARQRVTRAAVKAASEAHYADPKDPALCQAWNDAGNANLLAHERTSRAFGDVCDLADRLAAEDPQ